MKTNFNVKRLVVAMVIFFMVFMIISELFARFFYFLYYREFDLNSLGFQIRDFRALIFHIPISVEKSQAFFNLTGYAFEFNVFQEWLIVFSFIVGTSLFVSAAIYLIIFSIKDGIKKKKIKKLDIMKANDYLKHYQIIPNAPRFQCYGANNRFSVLNGNRIFFWFMNHKIHIIHVDFKRDFGKVEIDLDSIVSFSRYGDFYTTMNMRGGNFNVGGAIAGFLIAGGIGSIVAGRDNISAQTVIHDKRQTLIFIHENNQDSYIFLEPNAFDLLMHVIPSKEFSYVVNRANLIQQESKLKIEQEDALKKINELIELKDKGALTEDEFIKLKTKIID